MYTSLISPHKKYQTVILLICAVIGLSVLYGTKSLWFKQKPIPITPFIPNTMEYDYYPPLKSTNTLVVLLHGGSWMVGEKSQMAEVGHYLAKQGISVINLNYRLAPSYTYDAPLIDIALAIKQVEDDLLAFGLEDDYRLFLMGFSAGGHLATQFCLIESAYQTKEATGCISLAGIYDMNRIIDNQDGPILKEAVELFIGDTPAKDTSPLHRVKRGEFTRFLLIRGEFDLVVSPKQMDEFAATLKANSIEVEKLIVPNREHVTIFATIPEGDVVAKKILKFINP